MTCGSTLSPDPDPHDELSLTLPLHCDLRQYPVTDKAMPFGSGLLGMFYSRDMVGKIKSTLKLIQAS